MNDNIEQKDQLSPLKRAYIALEKMQTRITALERERSEPIAVIGLGCRLPGAQNPDEFWQLLTHSVDAISEVPPDRWDINAFFDPNPDAKGKMMTRWGGFLASVDQFDPHFFGISPRETQKMDPQQRLLLEVTWEALENAGLAPERLAGSKTGVFVGISGNDYSRLPRGDFNLVDAYGGTGNAFSIAANRISYLFDFQGPSAAVDTACSSSLVTVHLACLSLRNKESDLALAGGVNLILSPEMNITFSQARMMAADGHCKTFDAAADGYVRGEGCGMVVLKRLSDALKDSDNIIAVIRGSAVNQDGRSNGLTAPNGLAQQAVIRDALKDAKVTPEQIGFLETHGTGTNLGDPIEAQALGAVMKDRPKDKPVILGALKTNIGHLESAAGIAGLIKVALTLSKGMIPPNLHFKKINPHIPIHEMPLAIPTELQPWPSGYEKRIAGVSSFGFGGTNAHVILEEAPKRLPALKPVERPNHIVCLSAKNEAALKALTGQYEQFLAKNLAISLPDLAYSANVGRAHFGQRLAIISDSSQKLSEALTSFQNGQLETGVVAGQIQGTTQPRLAFLFTGQGAQYAGMGKSLYDTQPTFRNALDRCAAILKSHLDRPLLSVLFAETEADAALINETAYTQPALFAIEYALAELWQSWGIKPDYVIGHSVGEYVAACVAGVFSLEDGLKLIAARGRLMQSLPQDGDMAAVFADPGRVQAELSAYQDQVSIAGINGPANVVISGRKEALHQLLEKFQSQGLETRLLKVSHAFHSPLMEPILDPFEKIASEITFRTPVLALVSNLTGQIFKHGEIPDAKYWRQHIRAAVQFNKGMQTLAEKNCQVFLETGPHPTLIGMGRRCLTSTRDLSWLPSLKQEQNDWQMLLTSLASLYVLGFNVNWANFDRDYSRNRIYLPTYPFQREHYWFDFDAKGSDKKLSGAGARPQAQYLHPLLGCRLSSPMAVLQFESQFLSETGSLVADYSITGVNFFPPAAFVEMAFAAAGQLFGPGAVILEESTFQQPLLLAGADSVYTMQLLLTPMADNSATFEIYSQNGKAQNDAGSWTRCFFGRFRRANLADTDSAAPIVMGNLLAACSEEIAPVSFYHQLAEFGFRSGPGAQVISQLRSGPGMALAKVQLPEAMATQARDYLCHPSLLEACFQVLYSIMPAPTRPNETDFILMPMNFSRLAVINWPGQSFWCQMTLNSEPRSSNQPLVSIKAFDERGELLFEMANLTFSPLSAEIKESIAALTSAQAVKEQEEQHKTEAQRLQTLTKITLLSIPVEQRQEQLSRSLRAMLARVLAVAPDRVDVRQPVTNLGLDSIMAIELKNKIETSFETAIPIAALVQGPSILQLTDRILEQIIAGPKTDQIQLAPGLEPVREYPLSHGQRAMWFQHQMATESIFNIQYAVRIKAPLDLPTMQRTFESLVKRHATLRTSFSYDNGEPIQHINDSAPVFFKLEDASAWAPEFLQKRLDEEANRAFDLERGPLIRVFLFSRSEHEHILLLAAHHIVVDLWSLAILTSEVGQLYAAQGDESTLPPAHLTYTDYIRWQMALLESPEGERLWKYWQNKLADELPTLDLPTDRPRPKVQTFRGASKTIQLGPELSVRLKELAEKHNATLNMTLLAAFKILLYRYSGQEDIIVGSPTTGRSQSELTNLIGYFVNPVALRSQVSPQVKFVDFLTQVRQTVTEALAHQDYPFSLLVEKLQPKRDPSRTPIYQVMFVFQRAHLLNQEGLSSFALGTEGVQMNLSGLPLESVAVEQRVTPFDLTLMMAESEKGLAASLTFNQDLYKDTTINRMLEHFQTLLKSIIENPEESIARLSMLTSKEVQQLIWEFNSTESDFPNNRCIHELFEQQVDQNPKAIAVSYNETQLTYQELDETANQLARYLQNRGVGPETVVGVCVDRSLEMVVDLLGILKAGGAYLPIDPNYPADRIAYMIADSKVSLILTQKQMLGRLVEHQVELICLDSDWEQISQESPSRLKASVTAENLAYMIYTSGSTGRPKGVMLAHRGLCNLVQAQIKEFQIQRESRLLQFASFSFDASVSEIFTVLIAGASMHLVSKEQLISGNGLIEMLNDNEITIVTLPPSVLSVLPSVALPKLKTITSAGESCSWDIVSRWAEGRRFINAYGPTESTVCATCFVANGTKNGSIGVPIGMPIDNIQIYILDPQMNVVPVGVIGEIYIGGIGLARGYMNRPDLTAERFVPNPFSTSPGHRLYRTGDLARRLNDGNILFIGRIDHQVKVRGFRIELGEVEAVLEQHPNISAVVALARKDKAGESILIAYLVPDRMPGPGTKELRDFLKEKMPDYMIPSIFVNMEAFPLTPNGKVDRKKLPEPDGARLGLDINFIKPRNEMERSIADIWQDVLGLEKIGINDNFFDLGGHSLSLIKVHRKLCETMERQISVVEMFKYPTIVSLAGFLNQEQNGQHILEKSQQRAEKQKEALMLQRQRLRQMRTA